MILIKNSTFEKHFKKRILFNRQLVEKFKNRVDIFLENRANSIIKDHSLSGKMSEFRAFWITGDIRVVYKTYGDTTIFYDVGTHNQVYK